MIEITGVDLIKFVKKVYSLSKPQGLGFLDFTPEPLSNEEAKSLIYENENPIIVMDYVKGRTCKMVVFNKENKLFIKDSWYDHTDEQFKELLKEFNIESNIKKDHNISCNCFDCKGGK